MLGAIWASVKGVFALLGWWKQKSDQETGKDVLRSEDRAETIGITERINNARSDSDAMRRVHERSERSDE